MSLRRDVHDAFDEIAPPLGGMPERVVQTVLSDTKRRKKGMTYRARVPLPLVAVLVAAALLVSGFIGIQLMQGWIATLGPAPAGQVHLTALQQLEARPIRLPVYKSIMDCRSTPVTQAEGASGPGPVYAEPGSASRTPWGEYFFNIAFTDQVINGPILIRVTDLYKANGRILFVGPGAAGPIVGSDVVDGKRYMQHTELVLDESHTVPNLPGWGTAEHRYVWDFLAGVSKTASGGTGWQIDGAGFTETFLAC